MHDASRRLQDCLAEMYEPDWFGKEEMDTLAEVRQRRDSSDFSAAVMCFLLPPADSFCFNCMLLSCFLLPCTLKEMIEKELDFNLEVKF